MKKGKKILIGVTGAVVAGIAGITIGEKIIIERELMVKYRPQPEYGVMTIDSFNATFHSYERTSVSASQVKSLISLIKSNNAAEGFTIAPNDIKTDKYVYLNSTTENAITSSEQVENVKTYKVEITGYSREGYVNEITITENEDSEREN